MIMRRLGFLLLTLLLLGAVACSGATTETAAPTAPAAGETMTDSDDMDTAMDEPMSDDAMSDASHDTMSDDPSIDDATTDDMTTDDMTTDDMTTDDATMDDQTMDDQTMVSLPTWQTIPLTDARSGETFTLGDFAGKTVFVEPMATWCSNCRQQLTNVQQARAQMSSDDVVFVALSVETTISSEDLAQYADGLGFDWTFAVMSPELLQALADEFGRTVTNPPSTPHFVIRADGTVSELVTGIQSADEIAALTAN